LGTRENPRREAAWREASLRLRGSRRKKAPGKHAAPAAHAAAEAEGHIGAMAVKVKPQLLQRKIWSRAGEK
jgi:hypothetical protein